MASNRTGSSFLRGQERSRSKRWVLRSSTLAVALAGVYATPGFAQVAGAETTGESDKLETVVVTARRIAEPLQDIPASVSAISGEQIARMNSIADIQSFVSGVTFKTFGPIPTVGIRGYGNRTVAGNTTNSTVGIFQDGVFVAPPLVVEASRIDTDRIEVAKGPQSTLYGRSSFTGAINLVTHDPGNQFSGYVDAGLGESSVHGDTLYRVRGAVSVPITDTLSVRFFGLREEREGYTYDATNGNHGDGYDRKIGRVKVLWEPSDVFAARLTGTVIRDNLPLGLVHTGRNPAPLGQLVIFGNNAKPSVPAAISFGSNVWDASNQYVEPVSGKTKGEQATLDMRLQTPFGEIASLTDYQHSYQDLKVSLDLTRLDIGRGDTPFEEHRVSQELRLSNKIGPFSYLGGLYFLLARNAQAGNNGPDFSHPSILLRPGGQLYDLLGRNAIYQPSNLKTNAQAVFGQLGYDITDKLNLTAGLRRGKDDLSGSAGTYFGTLAGAIIPAPAMTYRTGSFEATTGTVNLSYKLAPDVVAYASYSRGNSPGGLNTGAAALINFAPQNVNAFEVGLKSLLLDRHLQLNAALFDNQYSALQITQNTFISGALVSLISNAGKARGRGVDLDAVAILSSNWRAGLQYTYSDSKITRYSVPSAPAPQVDFTGAPLVRSPRNSANASVTFTEGIGPGKFRITAEQSYTSSYTNDYQGVPAGTAYAGIPGQVAPGVTTSQVLALYRTPGYTITNLNANYSWGKWELNGSVRNLFNRQYIAAVLAFDTVSYPQELPGEPRTVEIALKYSF